MAQYNQAYSDKNNLKKKIMNYVAFNFMMIKVYKVKGSPESPLPCKMPGPEGCEQLDLNER